MEPGPKILETGYAFLPEIGSEKSGYGLYSYAILTSNSERSAAFLGEIFKSTPSIEETGATPDRLNIFYIPAKKEKMPEVSREINGDPKQSGKNFADDLYDFRMSRAILDHLCGTPAESMRELCSGDLSRGPYVFTYAAPASKLEVVPPPYLFVDLSEVNTRAFGELLSAFRAQVKREDISDNARINTLRLRFLQIALSASDWVEPATNAVNHAIDEILHSAEGKDTSEHTKKQGKH